MNKKLTKMKKDLAAIRDKLNDVIDDPRRGCAGAEKELALTAAEADICNAISQLEAVLENNV